MREFIHSFIFVLFERQREGLRVCVYVYVCMEREREREKQRQRYREAETERSSICWYTTETPTIPRVGPGQRQEPKTLKSFPCGQKKLKYVGHDLLPPSHMSKKLDWTRR